MAMVAELGVKVVEELVVVDITLVVTRTAMAHAIRLTLTCFHGEARHMLELKTMAVAPPTILEVVEVLVVAAKVAQESSSI